MFWSLYWSGAHSSASGASTFSKPRGIIPTIVYWLRAVVAAEASSVSVWPTMRGSALKRRRQNASLRITTVGPRKTSSAGWKSRPIVGRTPSTPKYVALTRCPCSFSGSPVPLSAGCHGLIAATASKLRLRSRSSRKL